MATIGGGEAVPKYTSQEVASGEVETRVLRAVQQKPEVGTLTVRHPRADLLEPPDRSIGLPKQ